MKYAQIPIVQLCVLIYMFTTHITKKYLNKSTNIE